MPLPTGVVTFLLTDVEGSSAFWDRHPDPMREALAIHDAILDDALTSHGGEIIRDRGEGDSYFAVFASATPAVAAALEIQRRLQDQPWPQEATIQVRIGINTGEAELRGGDYWGTSINRCGRIRALACGGQVLLGEVTANLARDALPDAAELIDLGEVPLRGMDRAERIFQLAHPEIPRDFPPLKTQTSGNLPRPLTSFVGRDAELDSVSATLSRSRLVTLTGPGGAGKTRLSLEIAAREAPSGGAWFADLSAVRDPAQVEEVVATAAGAREEPGRPLAQTLVERFRAEPALVVVDNCEQVLDPVATLVRTLLSGCPDLKVVATSREPLSVAGERVWPVRQLLADDALRLFEERAAAARPDFRLDASNRATVDRICERLDRIPLAIELAAARTRVLAPAQILVRLQDRFRLLSSADRSADPRQQTLRAAIDWSYTLLEAEERAFFESLSVFSGSFDLEAAEAIAGAAEVDALDALELLARLVDKSLVVTLEAGDSSRYRMLETLQEYAAERLREAGTDAVERAHLDYFLAWVERLRDQDDRGDAGRRFGLELANVRAALTTSERLEETELGLKLAVAAAPFWPMHGFVHEAAARLERALERTPTPDAYAHHELGWLLFYAGDSHRAAAAFERGAALAEAAGDSQIAGRCLNGAALGHLRLSELEAAEAVLRRSILVLQAAGDDLGLGQAHHYLAGIALLQARWADILAESRAALVFRRRAGDPNDVAQSEAFTGIALTRLGDLAESRQALLRALEVVGPALDPPNLTDVLDAIAQLAVEVGDLRFAVRLAAACQAMQDEVGMAPLHWTPWVDLAPARAGLGHEAEAVWEEGYALPLEAAVEEALRWLRETSPTGGRPAPPPLASA